MIQEYVWQVTPPGNRTVEDTAEAIASPTEDMIRLNRWVTGAYLDIEEDDLIHLTIRMTAHDRWWIRRRAPYLITSIATRARIPLGNITHTEVKAVPTLRKARFRTEDGKRTFKQPDGSEPEPRLQVRRCSRCADPAHWHHRSGWHTGDQIKGRDLRKSH